MKIVNTLVRGACGLLAAFLLLYGLLATRAFFPSVLLGIPLAAFLIAGWLGAYAALGDGPKVRRYLLAALIMGAAVGIPGCVIGGVGATFLYHDNMSPILGLFLTGPVGFAIGASVGVLRQQSREVAAAHSIL